MAFKEFVSLDGEATTHTKLSCIMHSTFASSQEREVCVFLLIPWRMTSHHLAVKVSHDAEVLEITKK